MNIATIIQARMNSIRLPKKVLTKIKGKPVLEYLVEQIRYKNNNMPIIIATSIERSDQKIVNYCQQNNIEYFQGDLKNVASRYMEIVEILNLDYFVRICADSPLLDGNIVKAATKLIKNERDIITNIHPRTFPKGQSVEIVNAKSFKKIYNTLNTANHFEHVTKYFYQNSHMFNIENIKNDKDLSGFCLAVDTYEDLEKIKKVFNKMTKPHYEYSYKDIIKLYG